MSRFKKDHAGIDSPEGRLGILVPGLGAVGTTFLAGTELIRRGLGQPFGSLTQIGHIRLGKRTDNRQPLIRDLVPLADLDQLVFGGWDIFEENAYGAACNAAVLRPDMLSQCREFLEGIQPMPAVFDREYVHNLDGPNVKTGQSKMDLARQLMDDIDRFRRENQCNRLVMVWCASTEVYQKPASVHATVEAFEEGLRQSDPAISPSMSGKNRS